MMLRHPVLLSLLLLLLGVLTVQVASGGVGLPRRVRSIDDATACTSIGVARKASTDGSTMVTHTDDCLDCDFRLTRIPSARWPEGSQRPIYGPRFDYPKFIGAERSPDYDERLVQRGSDLYPWTQNRPLGEIPQVRETYSYLEGNYGVLNAHQLGIGESTCAGKLVNRPVFDGGKAWFDVAELSRLAMERCRTARCAVKLMGALAERYGYFGAGWTGPMAEVEAGESLTISDPLEVWIFQILPDGTDAGAVWVAQRVPEDHVVVVANHFTIDHIIPGDEDFMYSRNVWEIAMEHGWWEPPKESEKNSSERSSRPRDENDDDGRDLDLDFDTALGEKETEEEFERFRWIPPFDVSDFSFRRVYTAPAPSSYKPYFNRRTWRVFDTFAPSLNLSAEDEPENYPFSVKVEKLASVEDLFALNRDHYEGTKYDQTKGLAAGPWGNPNRYDRDNLNGAIPQDLLEKGFFERSVSLFRTAYSFVTQSRSWLPATVGGRVWWGPHAPHSTCYVPFYAASDRPAPLEYSQGSLYRFGEPSRPAFCLEDTFSETEEGMDGGGGDDDDGFAECRLSPEQESDRLWSSLWREFDRKHSLNPFRTARDGVQGREEEADPHDQGQEDFVDGSSNHGSMFWSSLLLSNWAERFWTPIIPHIQAEQARLEKIAFRQAERWEERALELLEQERRNRQEFRIQAGNDTEHGETDTELWIPPQHSPASHYLHRKSTQFGKKVAEHWWRLFGKLAVKFRDGYEVEELRMDLYEPKKLFYPVWWLELVGFWEKEEWRPTVHNASLGLPVTELSGAEVLDEILRHTGSPTDAQQEEEEEEEEEEEKDKDVDVEEERQDREPKFLKTSGQIILWSVIGAIVCVSAFLLGRLSHRYSMRGRDYHPIPDFEP